MNEWYVNDTMNAIVNGNKWMVITVGMDKLSDSADGNW